MRTALSNVTLSFPKGNTVQALCIMYWENDDYSKSNDMDRYHNPLELHQSITMYCLLPLKSV